jgi:drug/metabolite transporter (DMT)-like permease
MSLTAIILLLVAAFSHAGWNLISKKQKPSGAFFMAGNGIISLCFIPAIIYFWDTIIQFPPSFWLLLLVTGLFNNLYYFSLAGAYRHGDLSMAYPIARSSPILVITFVTFILGQGHEIGKIAVAGIVMVVLGCFLLPLKSFHDFRPRNYLNLCCLLAGLSAFGTAGYTLVDNQVLTILRSRPETPLSPFLAAFIYMLLMAVICTLCLGVGVLLVKKEREQFVQIMKYYKMNAFMMGFGLYFAYTLVMTAMAYVQNISYVSAFREVSILIGALMGITLLKEPVYKTKIIGVLTVFIGLVLVAVG